MEMQCYCEKHECENYIDYMHHDDWSDPEDYCCETCADTCYPD